MYRFRCGRSFACACTANVPRAAIYFIITLFVILFIPLSKTSQPFTDCYLWCKPKVIILRQHSCAKQLLLQDVHKIQQIFGLAATYVIYRVRGYRKSILARLLGGCLGHDSHNSLYNVIHVGEVAVTVAVVVYLYGLTFQEFVGESKVCHIGPTGGAIDGEETQAGAGDVVELAVAVRHQLITFLGSCIKAHWVIHAVIGAEGHFLVAAIDATAAGIHQMLHTLICAIGVCPLWHIFLLLSRFSLTRHLYSCYLVHIGHNPE